MRAVRRSRSITYESETIRHPSCAYARVIGLWGRAELRRLDSLDSQLERLNRTGDLIDELQVRRDDRCCSVLPS